MTDSRDTAPKNRSAQWFGLKDKDGFNHRSWMKNQGLPHHLFDGRPVMGRIPIFIINLVSFCYLDYTKSPSRC